MTPADSATLACRKTSPVPRVLDLGDSRLALHQKRASGADADDLHS